MLYATKKLFTMATPLISKRLVQTLTTFGVMVMLAQLSHDVLAASILISMIQIVLMMTFMSVLFVIGPITGRQMGEKNFQHLGPIFYQSIALSLLLGIPLMAFYQFVGPILQWFHQPASIIPIVVSYFDYAKWAVPGLMLSVVVQQFLAGVQHQKVVFYLSILSLTLSLFFAYGLIFGHFGLPRMGVAGAGLSNAISVWLFILVAYSLVIRLHFKERKLLPFQLFPFRWGKLVLKVGLPVCFQLSGELLSVLALIIMVGWLGTTAMSASQISNQYMMFAIVPVFGLAEASSIMVSHAFGEKKFDLIHKYGRASMIGALIISLCIGLVFATLHRPLADIFIHFEDSDALVIYHLAMWLLLIRIIGYLFDGLADVLIGCLRGLYDTKYSMWVSLAINWLFTLPLSAFFGFSLHGGIIGIAIAGAMSRVVLAGLVVWRWQKVVAPGSLY